MIMFGILVEFFGGPFSLLETYEIFVCISQTCMPIILKILLYIKCMWSLILNVAQNKKVSLKRANLEKSLTSRANLETTFSYTLLKIISMALHPVGTEAQVVLILYFHFPALFSLGTRGMLLREGWLKQQEEAEGRRLMPRRWVQKCSWRAENSRNCDQGCGMADLLGERDAKEKLDRKG